LTGTRKDHGRKQGRSRALGLLLAAFSLLAFLPIPAAAPVVLCFHEDGSFCLESAFAPCCEDEGCPPGAAVEDANPDRPEVTDPGNPCCRDLPLSPGGAPVAAPVRAAPAAAPAWTASAPSSLPGTAGFDRPPSAAGRAPPGPPPPPAPSSATRTIVLRC